MRRIAIRRWVALGLCGIGAAADRLSGQPKYDLSKDKVLYCVGYAHLDTQWRWDFTTTIDKYILDTLDQNFERFEQFPGYVFNFTGSVRYEMMKEYYPQKYARLKEYIAAGRWFVSGSSVDEGDVNVPSAEAIIRQVLLGNDYFRTEFNRESVDFMLPDCFGFPASLPSIWAHCGLKGFSTQKLTWGSAVGIPFKIGVWEGPDGNSIVAALDPGPYVGAIEGRVDLNQEWIERVHENGRKYGVWADYHYYGVGDQGGAPHAEDIRNYLASMDQPDSAIKVALVSSDQMYKDITNEQKARLPRYKGDLLLTEHSAGTLTSQAYMKRWNRKNENLADAAERAAVAADWLGGAEYPKEKLNRSWVRLLANQMHDILPGTSIPRAYTYSWNDEIVAANGFAAALTDSIRAIGRALDTSTEGMPLVVYNPLATAREDVVEATIGLERTVRAGEAGPIVQVFDPDGRPVPTQLLESNHAGHRILFLARTPPLSWSVYDVRVLQSTQPDESMLRAAERELENEHYRVRLDDNGDPISIIDKQAGERELLAGPARLVFTREKPQYWPAWNMDWYDRQKAPVDHVSGPAKVRIVERGPVRVCLEVERAARNSIIRQRISLARGDAGRRLEFATEIDWQSVECALKASFPLTTANAVATYNWGMGTIQRGNNEPTKYEVPSHEWLDVTDVSGDYGVTILEDSKYGSDKPSDHEVRLTLLYTPGVRHGYLDQHSQDWGRHEMVYSLYGHEGDWRAGGSEWQGRRLNQPLRVWQVEPHPGPLGRSWSLGSVSTDQVDIRAIKRAENQDSTIIRVQELWGQSAEDVVVSLAGRILEADEVDGQERRIGPADVRDGRLRFNLTPYSPKSFRVRLAEPPARLAPPTARPVHIPFDTDVISTDGKPADGAFDAWARTLPAEMLPEEVVTEGIRFRIGPAADGQMNAVTCRGQTIELPEGEWHRVHLLAAADDDVDSQLTIGRERRDWSVQSWTGFIGQWDDRIWNRDFGEVDYLCDGQVTGFRTGYIKRDNVAWFCTHRHHPTGGNEPYRFSYLFEYGFPLESGVTSIRLPDDPRIKVLAVTAATGGHWDVRPASPLYDDFTSRKPVELRHSYPSPPKPLHEGLDPLATVVLDRRAQDVELRMGPPVASDIADQSGGRGLIVRFHDGDGEFRPHAASGAVGNTLPRLNDGLASGRDEDSSHCSWFDNPALVYIDLQQLTPVARINTYSRSRGDRARQFFSLWGSSAETMPNPAFEHGGHDGWTLLAVVDTREIGRGSMHGSSVEPPLGRDRIGDFRYLLWVSPRSVGTFFTELDVHAAE